MTNALRGQQVVKELNRKDGEWPTNNQSFSNENKLFEQRFGYSIIDLHKRSKAKHLSVPVVGGREKADKQTDSLTHALHPTRDGSLYGKNDQ